MKGNQAQIGVVRVSLEPDGEHVQAGSHPVNASNSTTAEQTAVDFALQWAGPDEVIFCDNQVAVQDASKTHGNRVRWLSRNQNKVADRVVNLRRTTPKRRRRGKRIK